MTQFAAAANPMFASFTDHPSFAPYQAIKPDQPLEEVNPAGAPMAGESSRMDFSREDQAPEQELNKAIWKSIRGAESHMPAPILRNRQGQPATDADGDG
jgi:hypothetical protein